MESMLHVGNNIDDKAREGLATTIERIFASGLKNHMSDAVVIRALDVVEKAYSVSEISVNDCTFTGALDGSAVATAVGEQHTKNDPQA